jgi:pSer/pThr/pTyr-binding forkhead associated (FHA) protein
MANLFNKTSKNLINLRSQHIFGRHSANSNTIINNIEASRLHASILWNGTYWTLQDTSSNGTFVNGEIIITGIKNKLKVGDIIQFGSLNADNWVFENDNAPKSMLVSLTNDNETIELDGIVALPNDKFPEITLYQTQAGEWVYENQSGIQKLEAGIKITINEASWYLVNAMTFDDTKKVESINSIPIENIKTIFSVSKDEEHVSVNLQFMNQLINLGERTHHYLLLILARKRLQDMFTRIDDSEQGWIDKNLLSQQIGLDENHINILIYRFRKQILKAMPSAMKLLQIIERRRGSIRFASTSIEINGGYDSLQNFNNF